MDRYNANYVVAACFVLTAVLIWAIGQISHYPSLLMVIVFVTVAFMNTAQASKPPLA